MQATIGRGPSTGQPIAKAALDLAVHDLCARAAGMSLRTFLRRWRRKACVELSYTVTAHDAAAVGKEVAAAREAGSCISTSRPPWLRGLTRGRRRGARGGGFRAFVWADANQGYNLHQARESAPRLAAAGVNVLEQPLPADQMHLMRELRKSVRIPLAVDESSVSPADFFAHAAEGLVDYLVVKVTRSGGVAHAGPDLRGRGGRVAAARKRPHRWTPDQAGRLPDRRCLRLRGAGRPQREPVH